MPGGRGAAGKVSRLSSDSAMTTTLISDWFGPSFERLHPLLQSLHREGGTLQGNVALEFGAGSAGWLGRRLARKMGLPTQAGTLPLEVTISHANGQLVWARRFGQHPPMVSYFKPVGRWPAGCFRESTGALQLELGVDLHDGGWHWLPQKARLHGMPVPLAWLPRTQAGKWIEEGGYRFEVSLTSPLGALLLRYGGLLTAHRAGAETPADTQRPDSRAGGTGG